jgi:hypothetical protein
MAKSRKELTFFEMTEDFSTHQAGRLLDSVNLGDVKFPFGFFIAEEDGKKVVVPGTKEDVTKRLITAFPDYPAQLIGVTCQVDVFAEHRRCKGSCIGFPSGYECMRSFEQTSRFFFCACVPIF